MSDPSRVEVSLCIATWRRPRQLARLLESLDRAKRPEGLGIEVVVVDNDPATDPAHPAAEGFTPTGASLCRVREPRRGLAYARNRGIDVARGTWLAFLDDDAVVEESWLAALWACAAERDADGYFGPLRPEGASPGPHGVWPRSGDRVERRVAHLRNALLRRPLFREVRFDPLAADTERAWIDMLSRRGARFEWCDEAVVRGSAPGARSR